MLALIKNDVAKIELLNMPTKTGYTSTRLLDDSGSACSILNWFIASEVVIKSPHTFWFQDNAIPQFMTFSKEPIYIEDKVHAAVSSNGWIPH